MRIGIPKETKLEEHRVALTPAGAAELVKAGHQVLVERDAGNAIGYSDLLRMQMASLSNLKL